MTTACPSGQAVVFTPCSAIRVTLVALCVAAGAACGDRPGARLENPPPVGDRLFTMLPSGYTGVFFENRLEDTDELNIFTYRNYYNGGGVALGDVTGDSLPDLVLTSNQSGSRLFVNDGEFRFTDVTSVAGLGGKRSWATGIALADVNADGRLDIYVCYAGLDADMRANELYINDGVAEKGVPTFTESADAFGIADDGFSTHAAFFDYDRDGDLDLYVVNNSSRAPSSFSMKNIRHERHDFGGDKLYRNDGDRFADVSEAAGILGSEFAFGLGIAVGDLNRDGWPDLYIANDFFERDYLYINNGDGTFAEVLEEQMPSISLSSMGLDIADIDNDQQLDLYVTDMLPEDDYRLKTTAAFEDWESYQNKLTFGYHHQFTRNMLHLNNGNGTFSEIGQMANVARTDWSWSALIADFDLDGHKDIHVTNGIPRDVTSLDYIAFLAKSETMAAAASGSGVDFDALIELMQSTPLPNYAFRNNGNRTFSDVSADWGLDARGFSNGAAYGDVDGDGDLDLVVNNVNEELFIYRNNAQAILDNHYLQIELVGDGPNRFGVGTKVTLRSSEQSFYQELMPSRGFQSSVDYLLTFGVGQLDTIQSVVVEWPDGRVTKQANVPVNQRLRVEQSKADPGQPIPTDPSTLLVDITSRIGVDFVHRENEFVDFRRQPLMPKLLSTQGPFMAVADVNGDGLSDVFIGGAREQPGQLLMQQPNGRFTSTNAALFERDRTSEDLGAVFFDATGNGRLDLYVVSGGSEFSNSSPALQDRLYLNDGGGNFRKAEGHLPVMLVSGARVSAHDFDADGDTDLFVGGRLVPWRYGLDPQSVLLENDGQGRFTDVTEHAAPELQRIGMVTDALWEDIDGDRRADLIVVGDWMPITIFRNSGDRTLSRIEVPGLESSHGWWNRIIAGDFTGDGRADFVVGNLGLNTTLRATESQPATMHVMDFDRNGTIEQILSYYNQGVSYPLVARDELLKSLPSLAPRYPNYDAYAQQTVADIFSAEDLATTEIKTAHTFETTLVTTDGNGSFRLVPLPLEAQIAPVHGMLARDFDEDGRLDLLLAGNFDGVKPELGRLSASYGLFLRGDGTGAFTAVPTRESGFFVPGEARDIQAIRTRQGELYVVTRNDERALVFRWSSKR